MVIVKLKLKLTHQFIWPISTRSMIMILTIMTTSFFLLHSEWFFFLLSFLTIILSIRKLIIRRILYFQRKYFLKEPLRHFFQIQIFLLKLNFLLNFFLCKLDNIKFKFIFKIDSIHTVTYDNSLENHLFGKWLSVREFAYVLWFALLESYLCLSYLLPLGNGLGCWWTLSWSSTFILWGRGRLLGNCILTWSYFCIVWSRFKGNLRQ